MNNNLLPIGTVCKLKETNNKIMITAFYVSEEEKPEKVYDYCGCMYPEGIIESTSNFLFDRDKIDKIIHLGYIDEEEKVFKEYLSSLMKQVESNKMLDNNINKEIYIKSEESNINDVSKNNKIEKTEIKQSIFSTLNIN